MYTNQEFLDLYLGGSRRDEIDAVLPLDKLLIEKKIADTEQRLVNLAQERADINSSTGDAWHDGALNENDHQKRLDDASLRNLKYKLTGMEVDYPDEDQECVSLGSTVSLLRDGNDMSFSVIGVSTVYDEVRQDTGMEFYSLEAPLVREIIGKTVGQTALLHLRKPVEFVVVSVEQTKVRVLDESYRLQ